MGVEPRYSYLDVIESLGRMDERLLYTFLEEHESGAWVMASPAGASMRHQLAPESVGAVLHLMRRHFEYVVVDVGRGMMDEAAATALDLADERLVVTTAELPTLRNVRQVLPHVSRSGDPAQAIRLVLNRYEDGVSVPTKDVERAVGLPLFQIVNEDRERVGRSVNLGRPLVMNGPSPFTKAVGRLGDRLAADDLLANGKKSPLGGLLRTLLPPFGRGSGSAEPANAEADARDRDAHERPRRANGRHGGHADASGHTPPGNGHRAGTNGRPDRTAPPAGPRRPMHKEGVR
jgi:Flp pilus assembly CpaE family ATPase